MHFESLHCICSLKFKVRPIDRLGLNWLASESRTNCPKYTDKWMANQSRENACRLNNRATLEKCKQTKTSSLQEDASEPLLGDSPDFLQFPFSKFATRSMLSIKESEVTWQWITHCWLAFGNLRNSNFGSILISKRNNAPKIYQGNLENQVRSSIRWWIRISHVGCTTFPLQCLKQWIHFCNSLS